MSKTRRDIMSEKEWHKLKLEKSQAKEERRARLKQAVRDEAPRRRVFDRESGYTIELRGQVPIYPRTWKEEEE